MDAAGQLTQLGDGCLGGGVGLVDQFLRGVGIAVDLLLRESEGHADRDQSGLNAVMQVALDAGALHVGGPHGAFPLRRGGTHAFGELGLLAADHDRERQGAMQQGQPDHADDARRDAEDADQGSPGDGDASAAERTHDGVCRGEGSERDDDRPHQAPEQTENDPAEQCGDGEVGDRTPHAPIDRLTSERTQPADEPGAVARLQAQRSDRRAVQRADARDLEPAESVQRVDQSHQQDEADARGEEEAEAGAEEPAEHAEDGTAEDADACQVQDREEDAQRRLHRRCGSRGRSLSGHDSKVRRAG